MKCSICERKSDGRFCEYHQLAYENVKETYEKWKEAAEVSWIEYLNEIDCELHKSGDWYILKSAQLKKSYLYGTNYEKSKYLYASIEIINQIIFHKEDSEKIYKLLKDYLDYQLNIEINHVAIFWRFILKLFDIIGIKLCLHQCSICKKTDSKIVAYAPTKHGFICEHCFLTNKKVSAIKLSENTQKIFSIIYSIGNYLENIKIDDKTINEINNIFLSHLQANFDKQFYLKSLK